jgi:hypothetical protein
MFQRGQQPASSSNAPPELDFMEDVEDLYADNFISAQRCHKVLEKAARAGIKNIVKQVKKPGLVRKSLGKNLARDITRRKLRSTKWPDYYWFDCRVWDRKQDKEVRKPICIFLIHEILEAIWKLGLAEVLLGTNNYDQLSKEHMQWMREQLGVEELWGFGIHGDGVPCNYDRTESVVVISINLPGLKGKNGRMRIPLVVLPDHAISDNTFDDIMEVFAWSMRHALSGTKPEARHDNFCWKASDHKRKNSHGALGFQACMVQNRADWDWLTKCFHFPGHATKSGPCWLCNCKRNQVWYILFVNKNSFGFSEC